MRGYPRPGLRCDSRRESGQRGRTAKLAGPHLRSKTCLGLEKASCGVESKRASLQGFESPSPHQYRTPVCAEFRQILRNKGEF